MDTKSKSRCSTKLFAPSLKKIMRHSGSIYFYVGASQYRKRIKKNKYLDTQKKKKNFLKSFICLEFFCLTSFRKTYQYPVRS